MGKHEATIWLFLRRMRTPLVVLNIFHAVPVLLLTLVPGVDSDGNTVYLTFFDAMYIVSYTITTIGFGEIPYAFTYAQRFVVFLTIYGTVPAWVYSIGYMITLLQDKTFINAVKMNNFRRKVAKLKQEFIIICGYNNTSKILIEKLVEDKFFRIVVIDKSPEKIEQLEMETYMPPIPAINADASTVDILKASGVESDKCKFLVTLFDDDQLNLKISVRARILNENIKIVSKASVKQGADNLYNIGVDHVIDPFEIIAGRIDFGFRSPYLFNFLSWINGGNLHISKSDMFPKGKYIVCSRGRFGKAIKTVLEQNGIDYAYLDINKDVQDKQLSDKEFFLNAGIEEATAVIAGTNDDAINLSIIATVRAMRPNIFIIVRENEIEGRSMFAHLRAEKIFVIDKITAINAYNYIDRPLTLMFLAKLKAMVEVEVEKYLFTITEKINKKPTLYSFKINPKNAFALCEFLKTNDISVSSIINNTYNNGKNLEVIFLAIKRRLGEFTIFPSEETLINLDDEILVAGTPDGLDELDMILNNHNELYFVLNKKEIKHIVLNSAGEAFLNIKNKIL